MTHPLHCIHAPGTRGGQRGMTLVELLVGLTLGLLVVGIAIGVLLASRSVSGTVSDASQLQQQASHIFRVMGRQIRQAGTLRLLLASQKDAAATIDIRDPVAFEAGPQNFNPANDTVRGIDSPSGNEFKLAVGYSNYTEPLHDGSTSSQQRDCLGQSGGTLLQSRFVLNTASHTLHCAGAGGSGNQPFAENVANFQVRYLLQAPNGIAQMQYVNADKVGGHWPRVHGVEVCLVLFGTEAIDMPDGSNYTDCADDTGTAGTIDMATLPAPRTRRMHMVFRSVYQLRGQGVAG